MSPEDDRNEARRENYWSTLIGKIRAGLCTPILGAGIALPTLPLGKKLAEDILKEEEADRDIPAPLPDRTDLAKVSEYIAVQREDNFWPKIKIAEYLKAQGTPNFGSPEEPHRILADLRLPLYLTTNYDDFMYKALQAVARPEREAARWNSELMKGMDSKFDSGYKPSKESPAVFHIHGHWDYPASMVVTEDDYLDFLVNTSLDLSTSPTDLTKKAILPINIRRAIADTSLLFIGYSLTDINFRVILRGLVGSLSPTLRHMSISVQYCDGQPGKLEKYMEEYFDHTLKVNVFWSSAAQFCAELKRRMR